MRKDTDEYALRRNYTVILQYISEYTVEVRA